MNDIVLAVEEAGLHVRESIFPSAPLETWGAWCEERDYRLCAECVADVFGAEAAGRLALGYGPAPGWDAEVFDEHRFGVEACHVCDEDLHPFGLM